jgi:hypothetical protein
MLGGFVIQHIDRDHRIATLGSSEEGGLVVQAQITAQPDNCWARHALLFGR